MIPRAEFDAYNKAVEKIAGGAESDVAAAVLRWCAEHPDASVAEKREAAKLIMDGIVQGYDDMAASLAAEWYDYRAEQDGARLSQAVTATTYKPGSVDNVARYQARKLAEGGDAAFAAACGEFARNDAMRSLNETILSNAGRDAKSGVRFARVPTGLETCAFCLMLASRGAVYKTRKTAGEFRHFHRRCDCKIVPGFEGDPDAILVEGIDPSVIRNRFGSIGERFGSRELDREVKLRDPAWLIGGDAKTDYSLNPMSEYGRLRTPGNYEPENIVDRRNEWRDLWAHRVLEQNGISAKTHGKDDIDLTINGEWWEVKSPKEPDEPPKPGRELSFVESCFRSAVRQFRKRGIGNECRIVFNTRYRGAPGDVEGEISRQMRAHGVKEVIFIDGNGLVKRFK